MKRVLLRVLSVLAWSLLAVLALAWSAYFHADLPVARRVARDLINQLSSGQIRGSLLVNRFDELSATRIVARHVMLFDGDGRRVVVADQLVLVPEPDILLHLFRDPKNVHFRSAQLSGGVVRLADAGDGMPTLFTSFNARTPAAKTPQPTPGLHVLIDDVALQDVTLYGDLLGLQNLRARQVSARGRMEILSDGDVAAPDAVDERGGCRSHRHRRAVSDGGA